MIVAETGSKVIVVKTAAGNTVIVLVLLIVPLEALIIALPAATAVTRPLESTVATDKLSEA